MLLFKQCKAILKVNSKNSVNGVQAVYSAVLPPSLMVSFYKDHDRMLFVININVWKVGWDPHWQCFCQNCGFQLFGSKLIAEPIQLIPLLNWELYRWTGFSLDYSPRIAGSHIIGISSDIFELPHRWVINDHQSIRHLSRDPLFTRQGNFVSQNSIQLKPHLS